MGSNGEPERNQSSLVEPKHKYSDAATLQRTEIAGHELARLLWEGPEFTTWLRPTDAWRSAFQRSTDVDWNVEPPWWPTISKPQPDASLEVRLNLPTDVVNQIARAIGVATSRYPSTGALVLAGNHVLTNAPACGCLLYTFDAVQYESLFMTCLEFLKEHGIPDLMTSWVAQLAMADVVRHAYPGGLNSRKSGMPRLSQLVATYPAGSSAVFVFDPPAVATPKRVSLAIEDFLEDVRRNLVDLYLGRPLREVDKQRQITVAAAGRVYLRQVRRLSLDEIADREADAGDGEDVPTPGQIRDSISLCLKWLQGVRSDSGKR